MHPRKRPHFLYPRFPFYAAVVALLLGQGCASLSKEECMVADWRLIGYQDGVAGRSPSALAAYREDCAEYAVVPDLDAYQAGRAEGLLEYCRAEQGYRLGKAGRGFPGVCPPPLEPAFRAAYNRGREVYLARTALDRTRTEIREYEADLRQLDDEKSDKLSELVSDGLLSEQRILILYEITEIDRERAGLEDDLAALEYELAERQAHLERLTGEPVR